MAHFVDCDRCGLRSVVRITKLQTIRGPTDQHETRIIDCPSCGIHEAVTTDLPEAAETHLDPRPKLRYLENRFGKDLENWDEVISEIAERGWTLAIVPTGMPIGVLGTLVIMTEYDPENDAPEIMEPVGVDDIRCDNQAILKATLRLCRKLDPSF